MKPKIAALIVAAGRGQRARSGASASASLPKQFAPLGDAKVLTHSVANFLAHQQISQVLVVISEESQDRYSEAIASIAPELNTNLMAPAIGGEDRQASVIAGLRALAPTMPDLVLIHDGARPFVSYRLISDVIAAIPVGGGAIPGMPMVDTVKRLEGDLVGDTIDRTELFTVQTPQGFDFIAIFAAHKAAAQSGIAGLTDDAAVARRAGMVMHFVNGDAENLKLTFPGDLKRAEDHLARRSMAEISTETTHSSNATSRDSNMTAQPGQSAMPKSNPRVGMGFDVHGFEPGDHVMLCGIAIPHHKKLKGHSDADVALHALTDALYGAIGEGDIGSHFPPSDPQWRGTASSVFLQHASQRVKDRGGKINNVDLTIICEEPKITSHRETLCANLAELLDLELSQISVKATTTERLGFTGRGEGIAAQAVVMIEL